VVHHEGGSPVNATYTIPNTGLEASAYLKFILERYETLPEYTAFIHGHETAYHQQGDRHVLDMIRTSNLQRGFIQLNNAWRCCFKNVVFGQWKDDVDKVLEAEFPDMFITCCCAQFIVSKENILRRSKEYYERVYAYASTAKTSMCTLEHGWHYIFTGLYTVVPREDDFTPPLKETLFASASEFPFRVQDIRMCYCGESPFFGTTHVRSKELYSQLSKKGAFFFMFEDDTCENFVNGVLHRSQYVQFVNMYSHYVTQFEKLYQDALV
jgi:hypothetical protein